MPQGATWAEVTLRAAPYDTPKLFLIRATHIQPEGHYRQNELRTQVCPAHLGVVNPTTYNQQGAALFVMAPPACGAHTCSDAIHYHPSLCNPNDDVA